MLLTTSIFTIILSLVLLGNNWKENKNAAFLSLFIIIVSLYGIAHYFVMYGHSPFWLAVFYNHFTPLMLLPGPLLYFYVRGTINDSSKLNKWDVLHGIPAIIQTIGIVPYSLQPFSEKIKIASKITANIDSILTVESNYLYSPGFSFIIRSFMLLAYAVYTVFFVWKKRRLKSMDDRIPKKQLELSHRWIIVLLSCILLIAIAFFIVTINAINTKPSIGLDNSYSLYLVSGMAYCSISFSLLLFPNILYGIPRRIELNPIEKKKKTVTKIQRKPEATQVLSKQLTEDPFYETAEIITVYLQEKKPFLNPDFSISDISIALKIPQNHVAYCINEIMETKFSKLKSNLRVAHAIELLKSGTKDIHTIEAIGTQSGFKTRSNFYTAFKEATGLTPTEYTMGNGFLPEHNNAILQ